MSQPITPASLDLSARMNQAMDQAIDRISKGETFNEITLERQPNEIGPQADAMYEQLLERLQRSNIRARWAGAEKTSGLTVAFGFPT